MHTFIFLSTADCDGTLYFVVKMCFYDYFFWFVRLKGFVEVSEGEEEPSESEDEVVGSDKEDKEESQEKESSDKSLSLSDSKMEEEKDETSREESAVPAPSEWDHIDTVHPVYHNTFLFVQKECILRNTSGGNVIQTILSFHMT